MSPKPARPEDADVLVPHRPRLGRSGAVVSPHGLASEAGLGVLRAGGNAVDAAIATNAALAVLAAHACGLGGDAFWLIWDGVELQGLNGSGRSGSAATLEAARTANGDRLPLRGPWTVTVPGAIRSWGDAHARFGRLLWPDLLAPAIELAEGFPASLELASRRGALGVDLRARLGLGPGLPTPRPTLAPGRDRGRTRPLDHPAPDR